MLVSSLSWGESSLRAGFLQLFHLLCSSPASHMGLNQQGVLSDSLADQWATKLSVPSVLHCTASLMTFKVDSSKAGDVCSNKKHLLCCSGFPRWCSDKESTYHCRGCELDPWVGKIPWRRKWQPTPVFLPGKFHGQRSLVGYSPWGHKEPSMTERACSMSMKEQNTV